MTKSACLMAHSSAHPNYHQQINHQTHYIPLHADMVTPILYSSSRYKCINVSWTSNISAKTWSNRTCRGCFKIEWPADSKSVPGFGNWPTIVGVIEQNKIQQTYFHHCTCTVKKKWSPLKSYLDHFKTVWKISTFKKKIKASLHHIRDLQKTAANMTQNRCNIYDNK